VGAVIDGMPSMIISKNVMVSLLYKYMQELHFQNELRQYHCPMQQQNLTDKTLGNETNYYRYCQCS
jgi:hypothetical protein